MCTHCMRFVERAIEEIQSKFSFHRAKLNKEEEMLTEKLMSLTRDNTQYMQVLEQLTETKVG